MVQKCPKSRFCTQSFLVNLTWWQNSKYMNGISICDLLNTNNSHFCNKICVALCYQKFLVQKWYKIRKYRPCVDVMRYILINLCEFSIIVKVLFIENRGFVIVLNDFICDDHNKSCRILNGFYCRNQCSLHPTGKLLYVNNAILMQPQWSQCRFSEGCN